MAAKAFARISEMIRNTFGRWQSPAGRDGRMIILLGANLIALIVAFTVIVLRQVGDTVVAGGEARAERLVKAAAYQLQNTLMMIDRSLRYAEREIVRTGGPSVLPTLVDTGLFPMQVVSLVSFTDPDGWIVETSAGPATERVRNGDREHIRVHLNGSVAGAYMGRPIVGRLTSRWSIPVSRAVREADGKLLGVLTASIDTAAIGAIWRDVGLMPDDILTAVAGNGEAWIYWPSADDSLVPAKAEALAAGRYIVAEEVVAGWPLKLRAALDRRRIVAEAAPVQLAILGVALAGGLLVLWFTALLVRKTRQLAVERDAANDARERMRAAIDVVPADFTEFDRDRRLLLFNRQARESNSWVTGDPYGRTLRELLQVTVDKFRVNQPERDWDAWLDEQIAAFDHGLTQEVHRPNGDWKRVYYADMPGGGRVVLRVDISELKQREELLEASERRYAELVGSLPDVVISVDEALCITYASDVAEDVLGIPPAQLIGTPLPSLIAPEDRAHVATVLDGMRGTQEKAETVVCEFVRGDGATRFMQLKLKTAASAKGGEDALVMGGVIRDIHEQHILARKLDHEMALLNSIFQSTGAFILMLDREQRVIMANQALLDFLRLTADQAHRAPFDELALGGLPPTMFEEWLGVAGHERLKPVEFEIKAADGKGRQRIVRITANPVQDENGILRYAVLIGVDDTERRLAEIRLFDASRLANLGEMASGVAHEINQPLAVIRLAAESVVEELEGPDAIHLPGPLAEFLKQKLERIAGQTERASGIIRDLRTVARKPGNDSQPFELSEAVRVGCDLLQEQMRLNRIQFTLDLPKKAPRIMGEPGRIQQVVINLVNNARDALIDRRPLPERGPIGRIDVRVGVDPASKRVTLTIEDDGPGIPEYVLAHLFEPFFTTKPAGKGTGLGLSISYDIVNRMGGEMTAGNRAEGGARFHISFPPMRDSAEDLRPAA
jgi:PAS domain S-box-containing protein